MDDRKEKKSKAQEKGEKAADAFLSKDSLRQDPAGSYTGNRKKRDGRPDQDADDI